MALGATTEAISAAIVWKVVVVTAAGLVVGAIASLALSPLLSSLLFGVEPVEWVLYSSVATLLLILALFAGYGPARRAGRLSPLMALSTDY
jgi:ABC-type antimicrobial peptide transport system permease subunit